MKELLQEIRNQPPHIREIFMWTMVVITFSVVGFIGLRSTTRQFVALLHPEEAQERALAQQPETSPLRQSSSEASNQKLATKKSPSPFATIFSVVGDLRANISELLSGPKSSINVNNNESVPFEEQLLPQKLPISE